MTSAPATQLTATYRLQLHGGFTFADAAAITDYLHALGVSHAYCSPYLQATKGSTHGYDVVDHSIVNDELGGSEAHMLFCLALGRNRLGQVLDIVPNHMAIGTRANKWWWDVLENGPSSRYASYFDVEWAHPEEKLRNLMLVPILGDHYGRVLENRELRLEREGGSFLIRYHDHVLPAAPRSVPMFLSRAADRCGSDELGFLADAMQSLPLPTLTDIASVARRHRDKEVVRARIDRICREQPDVAQAIDAVLEEINNDPDQFDAVFGRQNFRVAFWRVAGRELGYRRFFDINNLVALRMEDEHVFEDTHKLVLSWLRQGVIDGVRIDHPDGLKDPAEYLDRIYAAAPQSWILAEKILEPGETLRSSWKIHGTTGYDFLFLCSNLFVDPEGEQPFTEFYAEFTGEPLDYHKVIRDKKQQVLRGTLGSDVNRLTASFMEVCERHRRHRDYTRHEIHQVVRETVACFPVYRTYVRAYAGQVEAADRHYVDQAIDCAKENRSDLPADLFDFLRSVLLLETTGDKESEFVMRFQQFTGPAMAKGVEDTTFYTFNRLSSLNEVGGDPSRFGIPIDEFHRAMHDRQKLWPYAMLASSTHDTKRSEDVRARIHAISEIPGEWTEAVKRWAAHNEKYKKNNLPDRNMEYLMYQALFGTWPIDGDRLVNYLIKASREAKTHTSWTDPNPEYDEALKDFVIAAMRDEEFLSDVAAFTGQYIEAGRINSLAQTLIKLTAPGIPDIYQGTEIWDLSLVDPDNRRPVDYELRRKMLRDFDGASAEDILRRSDEGHPKLWVIKKTLEVRWKKPELFGADGCYQPVAARGEKAGHVIAFLRGDEVATVVPRFTIRLGGRWGDTAVSLPEGDWKNELTGETFAAWDVNISELLKQFPVALLTRSNPK
jgi:(1->4)-alpha-D-glucan 1-alpha-D-glucosylmutase